MSGCRFKPSHDMDEQPNYRPAYRPSEFFSDGTSARPIPPGAVPRERTDTVGFVWADVRDRMPADAAANSASPAIPFPITREVLERGQQRFNIYCSMCHGRVGNGDGMIVHRGFSPPPSFHIERLRNAPDAHFYNVIGNGYGAMFSYNDRVIPEDRWMIVAYIRALQAGSASASARLTDDDRRALQGVRP